MYEDTPQLTDDKRIQKSTETILELLSNVPVPEKGGQRPTQLLDMLGQISTLRDALKKQQNKQIRNQIEVLIQAVQIQKEQHSNKNEKLSKDIDKANQIIKSVLNLIDTLISEIYSLKEVQSIIKSNQYCKQAIKQLKILGESIQRIFIQQDQILTGDLQYRQCRIFQQKLKQLKEKQKIKEKFVDQIKNKNDQLEIIQQITQKQMQTSLNYLENKSRQRFMNPKILAPSAIQTLLIKQQENPSVEAYQEKSQQQIKAGDYLHIFPRKRYTWQIFAAVILAFLSVLLIMEYQKRHQ